MSTVIKTGVISFPFNAIKAALKVVAESTTPSPVSNPLRASLVDQAAAKNPACVYYRDYRIFFGGDEFGYFVLLPGLAITGSLADIQAEIDILLNGVRK